MDGLKFSLEVTARTKLTYLPKIEDIYITFRPGADYMETVRKAEELKLRGHNAIPHFPARSIKDLASLKQYVKCVKDLGITQVLIIGGDRDLYGAFHSSLQLIETGLFEGFRIGIAGHPDGSPNMSDKVIRTALAEKTPYAHYIVTQWSTNTDGLRQYIANAPLPVHVGLAGPATLTTLLKYARLMGLENTLQFARKNLAKVADLLIMQTPNAEIDALKDITSHFHIYAFGGLKRVNEWLTKNKYL